MKKMSFHTRLILTTVVFAIPIVMLILQMFDAKTVNIEFAKQEKVGNLYQRPLQEALEAVSLHRLAALAALSGQASAGSSVDSASRKVDAAFEKITKADEILGELLQFTPEGLGKRHREKFNARDMKAAWTDLKGKVSGLKAEESEALHKDLIAGLRTMITHAGDTSNLILDPDLDSYYLMDVTLAALPQTQDHLQDVVATVEPLLRKQAITQDDRVKFAVQAYMLKDGDLARVNGSADTAINEDQNFYGKSETLEATLKRLGAAHTEKVEALVVMLNDLAQGKPVDADKFSRAGHDAIAASHDYWRGAVTELDILLQKRIDDLVADRQNSMFYSGLALGFAILFSFYIGHTLRASVKSILASVNELRGSAEITMDASSELVGASNKVSSAATEQSAAIHETVATLNEIDAMVGRSVESANRSAHVAKSSQDVAKQGQSAVTEMISSIDEINRSNREVLSEVERNNVRIGEIVKLITEIGEKTKIINDIVFQTKLLSFNASVEAARAGQHGKGFAVVAEEVGNLARMSGTAADEISSMLGTSVRRAQEIIVESRTVVENLVRKSTQKIEAGSEVARRCGDALTEIVSNVQEVYEMMDQVATAQKEQAQGVTQISDAMHELDRSTMQNTEAAQQTAEFAERLSSESMHLRGLIEQVEREILGRQAKSQASPEVHSDDSDMHEDHSERRAG